MYIIYICVYIYLSSITFIWVCVCVCKWIFSVINFPIYFGAFWAASDIQGFPMFSLRSSP